MSAANAFTLGQSDAIRQAKAEAWANTPGGGTWVETGSDIATGVSAGAAYAAGGAVAAEIAAGVPVASLTLGEAAGLAGGQFAAAGSATWSTAQAAGGAVAAGAGQAWQAAAPAVQRLSNSPVGDGVRACIQTGQDIATFGSSTATQLQAASAQAHFAVETALPGSTAATASFMDTISSPLPQSIGQFNSSVWEVYGEGLGTGAGIWTSHGE